MSPRMSTPGNWFSGSLGAQHTVPQMFQSRTRIVIRGLTAAGPEEGGPEVADPGETDPGRRPTQAERGLRKDRLGEAAAGVAEAGEPP